MNTERLKNIYLREVENFSREISKLQKKSKPFLLGKIITFSGLLYGTYLLLSKGTDVFTVAVVTVLLAAYCVLYYLDNKRMASLEVLERKKHICTNEYNAISGDYSPYRDGSKYIDTEHEFSYDLDLFGENSFFHRINRCVTEIGEQKLSEKLTNISIDDEERMRTSNAIAEITDLHSWRLTFLSEKFINYKSIYTSVVPVSSIFPILRWTLLGCFVMSILLSIFSIIPYPILGILFTVQIGVSMLCTKRVGIIGMKSDKALNTFKGYSKLCYKIENQNFSSEKLNEIKDQLFYANTNCIQAFNELAKILNWVEQRHNEIMFVVLNGCFMMDIYLVLKYNKWVKKYASFLDTWIGNIGEVDALVSLATYAYNTPETTVARNVEDENPDIIVRAAALYHPFLANKHVVPNSFELRKNKIAIVTGANMAGKSTFLRTIGVNYILACIGAPVCAKSFEFTKVSLFSSMRTTDNLSKDISYFNAELLRIKKLLLHIKQHTYTFVILDEILKGTNSQDKFEGSKLFLHTMEPLNVSCIIATHDLGLSQLETEMPSIYTNYCFEIAIADTITYSYKMSKGVAKNRNATYLLSNIIKETDCL